MIKSIWVDVNGCCTHARTAVDQAPADVPTVVLVHGLVVSSRYMMPLMQHLAPFYRVYAPDLPGFGQSESPDDVLSIPQLADALAAWLDSVQLETVVMLANSAGCQVIAELAVRYPQRLCCAILQGPTFDPEARSLPRQIARWLLDGIHEPPSHAINLILDYRDAGVRRSIKTLHHILRDRIETKLPRMQAPTLVVRGTRDPIVPARWAEEATRLLPHGRLAVVPGATHTMVYAFPLELTRVVRPFIEQHVSV